MRKKERILNEKYYRLATTIDSSDNLLPARFQVFLKCSSSKSKTYFHLIASLYSQTKINTFLHYR